MWRKAMKPEQNVDRRSKPLVSQITILILGGYLLGMISSQIIPEAFRAVVGLAGVCGVAAFFGLRWVAQRRRSNADRLTHERAASMLEKRVDRHIPRRLLVKRRKPFRVHADIDRQYLPVVRS